MKKKRQPNAAGFLPPTSLKKTVVESPVVEVESPKDEPKPEEKVVVEVPPVNEEPQVTEPVEVESVKADPVDDGDDDEPIAL